MKLYAQGDVLLELVADAEPVNRLAADADGAIVLARGVPPELYIGHIKISGGDAVLRHEEHGTITLPKGTYRARRQREWDAAVARIVAD